MSLRTPRLDVPGATRAKPSLGSNDAGGGSCVCENSSVVPQSISGFSLACWSQLYWQLPAPLDGGFWGGEAPSWICEGCSGSSVGTPRAGHKH